MQFIEQLEQAATQETITEKRLSVYIQLVSLLLVRDQTKAKVHLEAGILLAKTSNNTEVLALFYYYRMLLLSRADSIQQLFNWMEETLILLQKIERQALHTFIIGWFLKRFATEFSNIAYTQAALAHYQESLSMLDNPPSIRFQMTYFPTLKTNIYLSIVHIYLEMNKIEEAWQYLKLTEYFTMLMPVSPERELYDLYVASMRALLYRKEEKYQTATHAINQALAVPRLFGTTLVEMQLYYYKSEILFYGDKVYEMAVLCLERAMEMATSFQYNRNIIPILRLLGQCYEQMGDVKKELECLKRIDANTQTIMREMNLHLLGFIHDFLNQEQDKRTKGLLLYEVLQIEKYPTIPKNTDQNVQIFSQLYQSCQAADIQKIAQQLHISSRTLNRRIHAWFGLPTKQFIIYLRMQKAYSLLISTNLSISQIAAMAGYDNLSHFGILFRKHFGMLPSKIRPLSKNI